MGLQRPFTPFPTSNTITQSKTSVFRFLVAGYATLHPALSVRPSVALVMGFLALLLLPKCSTDLNHGPYPPARD